MNVRTFRELCGIFCAPLGKETFKQYEKFRSYYLLNHRICKTYRARVEIITLGDLYLTLQQSTFEDKIILFLKDALSH